jgi:hypothetical protein
VTTGPDRLAIVNADGSFQNPLTELHIRTIAEEVMAEYEPPDPGGGGVPLTSYVSQIATLPDYPTSFPATTHSHSAAQISDASTAGRALLTATTAGDRRSCCRSATSPTSSSCRGTPAASRSTPLR